MTTPTQAEVDVRALAAGGDGVADLPDGRVVFVPRTAPGDRARIELVKDKKRWARGRLLDLVTPAPERAEPPCRLYHECGGCTLQHVTYQEQLRWKGRFVADALQRIGGLNVDPPPVTASPHALRYRNRVTYTLRRLRGGRVVAGLHGLDRPAHVLDVHRECLLPEESLTTAWTDLRAAWGHGARLLPGGGRLSLTLRSTGSGVILVVGGGEPGWDAGALAAVAPFLQAIWHQPARDRPAMRVAGDASEDTWGEDRFPVSGHAFLQVNREAAGALVEHVVGQAAAAGTDVVDAYCGVGLYGRALARAGHTVTGIELDPAACEAAAAQAPEGFTVLHGAVEERLGETLPVDLVILNPPRTGIHEAVAEMLLGSPPARVVYVSCDPATLARDAALLSPKYRIGDVHAFDLFPQTAHVETVATFESDESS